MPDKQIDVTQSFETMNPIDFDYIITTLQEKLVISKISLDKLAKLGNGEHYGNSDGNIIAQEAITKLNE